MLWGGTEARLLTFQRKGVRWGKLDGKDEVREGQVWDWERVRAEMEMKRRAGGSVGEHEEWLTW
jgi:hypothetical protein